MRQFKGFTLIELLLSIMIFTLLSGAAFKLFDSISTARATTDGIFSNLSQLQRLQITLENDLSQVALRPARNEYGDEEPALKLPGPDNASISFSRTGWRNPLDAPRSSLQRLSYGIEDGHLIRTFWSYPDRAHSTSYKKQRLLESVTGLSIKVLDQNQRWLSQWPSEEKAAIYPLPQAIEVVINQQEHGEIKFLIPMTTYQLPEEKS